MDRDGPKGWAERKAALHDARAQQGAAVDVEQYLQECLVGPNQFGSKAAAASALYLGEKLDRLIELLESRA